MMAGQPELRVASLSLRGHTMKWARDVEEFIAREREKFSAAQAGRRPDRNVCCKCGYDLTWIAKPLPTPSEPGLLCPECGKSVAMRDDWRTDGADSIALLLCISICCALVAVASHYIFVVNNDSPLYSAQTPALSRFYMVLRTIPIATLLLIGPLTAFWAGFRGATSRKHAFKRGNALLIPFGVVIWLDLLFGRMLFNWIAS